MAVAWGTPLAHAVTKGILWAVESCSLETTFWTARVSGVGVGPARLGWAEGEGVPTGAQVS